MFFMFCICYYKFLNFIVQSTMHLVRLFYLVGFGLQETDFFLLFIFGTGCRRPLIVSNYELCQIKLDSQFKIHYQVANLENRKFGVVAKAYSSLRVFYNHNLFLNVPFLHSSDSLFFTLNNSHFAQSLFKLRPKMSMNRNIFLISSVFSAICKDCHICKTLNYF